MTKDEAEVMLQSYASRGKLPGPARARLIAIARGIPTLASNGKQYPPLTRAAEAAAAKAEERQRRHDRYIVSNVGWSTRDIAETSFTPAELLWRFDEYDRYNLRKFGPQAAKLLAELVRILAAEPMAEDE